MHMGINYREIEMTNVHNIFLLRLCLWPQFMGFFAQLVFLDFL